MTASWWKNAYLMGKGGKRKCGSYCRGVVGGGRVDPFDDCWLISMMVAFVISFQQMIYSYVVAVVLVGVVLRVIYKYNDTAVIYVVVVQY